MRLPSIRSIREGVHKRQLQRDYSKVIMDSIKTKSFSNLKDRRYVEDLILLQSFIEGGLIKSLSTDSCFNALKDKYPKEYEAILKDWAPNMFENEKKEWIWMGGKK